ncbi:transducin beta-like protein 3 isoform X2 [Cephus cinctus]|uniref:Transducin beta-like protein 3 isoform X2 n=1 Tax=Cephus cinctus TaxID=211228 RepID=A0AAJ7FJY1_CEPCN|nr:transducin beta-like protein 3 isoform X2 [Cephus cinctus]
MASVAYTLVEEMANIMDEFLLSIKIPTIVNTCLIKPSIWKVFETKALKNYKNFVSYFCKFMMSSNKLKEAFEVETKYGAFYMGGNIEWSADGDYILCQKIGVVSVVNVNKGSVSVSLGETGPDQDEDTINTFTLFPDSEFIVSHHKSGLFKLWDWKGKLKKMWKSIHNGPVAKIAISSDGLSMSSGGSDSNVRMWDLQHHACTHSFKGIQGVVSVLAFHPDTKKQLLFAAGDDTKIHVWNTQNGREERVLSGHFSKITSISFHDDGIHLVSSGRDKVLILWNITKGTAIRTVPVFEGIEGAFILPKCCDLPFPRENSDGIYVAAAGEKGIVKIWEMREARQVYIQKNSLVSSAKEEGGLAITHLLYNPIINCIVIASVDHNIIIHSMNTFQCKKQLVGYSDEILDIACLGTDDSHLAVATNSADIKLYELVTMDCQLLCGHTDLILSLGTTPADRHVLISSAKDNSVRVWYMNSETKKVSSIASAVRHTASVGSVAVSNTSAKFFVSASQDSCIKLWNLPEKLNFDEEVTINVTHTELAHEKDINSIAVSPNDRFIATGSQDKTAKLWTAEGLQLLGVLRGHRRGVWCVRFSPIDQVLLTTSADCTLKFWSLTDLNCLKTLEGHESSVLKAEFLSRGMQLISSGGDGLLKLWSVKTSECIATLDEHDSRVWALTVNAKESHIISGGSDSLLVVWRDVTEEKLTKAAEEKEELALGIQRLANLLKADKLTAALKLALRLERPFQVLKIIDGIIKKGKEGLVSTIQELKPHEKESLLRCAVTWNTNSRNSQAAQLIMYTLLDDIGTEQLQSSDLGSSLEAMIPYTERHFKRLTQLIQDLHILEYTINRMKPHTQIGH